MPSTFTLTQQTENLNNENVTNFRETVTGFPEMDQMCEKSIQKSVDLVTVDSVNTAESLALTETTENDVNLSSQVTLKTVESPLKTISDTDGNDVTHSLHIALRSFDIEPETKSTPSTATRTNLPICADDIEVKKEELEKELNQGTRFIRYTPEEDSFLRLGVKKYGLGRWSHILKDDQLTFHKSRTRDSLRMRAETIGLSKKRKSKRECRK